MVLLPYSLCFILFVLRRVLGFHRLDLTAHWNGFVLPAGRSMFDFVQVLDHAGLVQPICPERGEQIAEEVEKSQGTGRRG